MAFLYPGKGSSIAIRTPARKSSPRSASQFLYTVPDLPGTRSTQAGHGVILPSCQVHDAGEFTRAAAAVLLVPHASHRPPVPARLRSGRGHQMRLAGTACYGRYSTWCRVVGPGHRWWLPRSTTDQSPSGSPGHPNVPWGRAPSGSAQ